MLRAHWLEWIVDRRGNVALITAIAIVPLIIAIGAAVDLSRAYTVRSRLAFSLDAAGLAVGSSQGTDDELQQIMSNFFYKNYPEEAMGTPVSLRMVIGDKIITLSAAVDLETTFMKIAGINTLSVAYSNEITKEVKGLEVVLALDTTGSMASDGKIAALRSSATDLVDILFGNQNFPEKLKVGLVPFVTSVNIGNTHDDMVNWDASQWTPQGSIAVTQASYTTNADGSATGTVWKGCVKERAYPHDVSDTGWEVGGKWAPYFWPREPRTRPSSTTSNTYCSNRSSSHGITLANNVGYRWDAIDETASDSNYAQAGPNKACPRALVPLTNDKNHLLSEVGALVPWGDDTGTMVHIGAAWAWRVISPEAPFTEGLPYNTEGWNKAIILLTDGDNTSIRQSNCRTQNGGPDHSYTAYGYVSDEGTLDTSGLAGYSARAAQAIDNENARLTEVCRNIKARNVILYTIALGTSVSSTAQSLLRSCATDTSKYFASPSSAELRTVFQQIAKELSNLRVSK